MGGKIFWEVGVDAHECVGREMPGTPKYQYGFFAVLCFVFRVRGFVCNASCLA